MSRLATWLQAGGLPTSRSVLGKAPKSHQLSVLLADLTYKESSSWKAEVLHFLKRTELQFSDSRWVPVGVALRLKPRGFCIQETI